MDIQDIIEELRPLTKRGGELDAAAVAKASGLLALPRYALPDNDNRRDLLLADLKAAVAKLPEGVYDREGPGLVRAHAEALLITRPGKNMKERWKEVGGTTGGTARKWHRHFLLGRIAFELLELYRAESEVAVSHRVLSLHIHVDVSHPEPNKQLRLATFVWKVQSATSDLRTFAFPCGAPNLDFSDWRCESAGHMRAGRVPLRPGTPRGNHLYVVYLGGTLPVGQETTITVTVEMTGPSDAEPWLSYTPASEIGELLLTADVPTEEATHYECKELASAAEMADELWSDNYMRDGDATMTYDPASTRVGHRYRLEWSQ